MKKLHGDFSVSIIIPVYNGEAFIGKTLESVFSQDYGPMEILVADDGSTDNTLKVAKSFSERVSVLQQPNKGNFGAAAARNLAITHSQGKLIAFLDHDDLWYPDKINKQVSVFKNHPEVNFVYTNGYFIDDRDNVGSALLPDHFEEPEDFEALLLTNYIRTPSEVMVRKKLFDQAGLFDPKYKICADHDLWIRMRELTRFYYIPDHLIGYRRHSNQLSSLRKMYEEGFELLSEAFSRYPHGPKTQRKARAILYYRLALWDCRHKSYKSYLRNLLTAVLLDTPKAIKKSLSRLSELRARQRNCAG